MIRLIAPWGCDSIGQLLLACQVHHFYILLQVKAELELRMSCSEVYRSVYLLTLSLSPNSRPFSTARVRLQRKKLGFFYMKWATKSDFDLVIQIQLLNHTLPTREAVLILFSTPKKPQRK